MSQDTIERLRDLLGVDEGVLSLSNAERIIDELDAHDARLAAMEARLAEREQALARLRREMDALLAALRATPVGGPTRFLALACGEAILEAAEAKPCG